MNRISATHARRRWALLLGHVFHTADRVYIIRHDVVVAGLVHPDEVDFLERLADEADIDEARRAIAEAHGEPHLAWPELRRYAGLER